MLKIYLPLQVSEKPFEKLPKVDTTRGYVLSFAQTLCQLKINPVKITGDPKKSRNTPYAGYLLDVSNDGKTFSTKSPMYLVYDSKCIDCTSNGTCTSKVKKTLHQIYHSFKFHPCLC